LGRAPYRREAHPTPIPSQENSGRRGNTVCSEINAVRALAMIGNPGISGNEIVKGMHIQKSSWAELRAFLETRQYIECERNDGSENR
jgi:hypothetical protein